MDKPSAEFIFACRLDELVVDGMRVVHGGPTPLLLVHDRARESSWPSFPPPRRTSSR